MESEIDLDHPDRGSFQCLNITPFNTADAMLFDTSLSDRFSKTGRARSVRYLVCGVCGADIHTPSWEMGVADGWIAAMLCYHLAKSLQTIVASKKTQHIASHMLV